MLLNPREQHLQLPGARSASLPSGRRTKGRGRVRVRQGRGTAHTRTGQGAVGQGRGAAHLERRCKALEAARQVPPDFEDKVRLDVVDGAIRGAWRHFRVIGISNAVVQLYECGRTQGTILHTRYTQTANQAMAGAIGWVHLGMIRECNGDGAIQ